MHTAFWLTGLIAISAAYRIAAARSTVAPFIFPDELIYTDLARSFAESGSFIVAGAPFPPWSFGPLYPALIAPVFAVTHDPATAYAGVKLLNAILVSMAAVPAYLLGRRLLECRAALLFAATALLVPSLVYSTKVMTESLAYPVFLWATLSIQRAIERPLARRQVEALAVIGLAVLARAQMIVLLPAFVTALVGLAMLSALREGERPTVPSLLRRFAAHRLTWWTLFAAALVGAGVAGTSGSRSLLGLHTKLAGRLDLLATPRWLLYHLAELDFASGVLPFVAFLLLASRLRHLPRSQAVFVITTSSVGVWLLTLTAAYATQPLTHPRIYERYVFYLVPLLVLGLFTWAAQGLPRQGSTRVLLASAALLPLAIPFGDVLVSRQWGVNTATVGLVPWGLARLAFGSLVPVYMGTGIMLSGCAALVLRARPERAGRLRLWVITYFLLVGFVVHAANLALASRSARLGASRADRSWIDHRVGSGAQVAALWSGTRSSGWHSGYGIWENAFFNRSVKTVYTLHGDFPGNLASIRLTLRGKSATADGKPVTPRYVLADPTTRVEGTVLESDRHTGMTLYRVRGRLQVRVARSASR